MPTIDFIPFATGAGANVETQAAWVADTVVPTGFQSGITLSIQMNKALRQGTFGVAGLSNYMSQITGQSIADNGSIPDYLVQLWLAALMSESFVDSGSANTIVLATPGGLAFSAPVKGIKATVQVIATNTGATTLNWMSNGAVVVKTQAGAALSASALTAGGYYTFVFDGTEWQLLA